MDIEKLNKSQIVLLTLLVSFVTSIATGIVTVSLMEQAPTAITQTVNRVVERTIEKVAEGQVAGAAVQTVTETVVIRESDLISEAVAAAEPSLVRLFASTRDAQGMTVENFVGIAIVISDKGELVADVGTPDGPLKGVRNDGTTVPLAVVTRQDGQKVVHMQAPLELEGKPLGWIPAKFIATLPTPGQAVVTVGGAQSTRLGGGIVIGTAGSAAEGNTVIETNIGADSFGPGSPLLTADGIVGMATGASRAGMSGFLASSVFLLQNNEEAASP
jgi:hypothetical protein